MLDASNEEPCNKGTALAGPINQNTPGFSPEPQVFLPTVTPCKDPGPFPELANIYCHPCKAVGVPWVNRQPGNAMQIRNDVACITLRDDSREYISPD